MTCQGGHVLSDATFKLQVGDSDQKLADGITLYSIVAEMHDKPSVIAPLIAVWIFWCSLAAFYLSYIVSS